MQVKLVEKWDYIAFSQVFVGKNTLKGWLILVRAHTPLQLADCGRLHLHGVVQRLYRGAQHRLQSKKTPNYLIIE
jgi:hypothetical protein